ncbi:MAG: ATP-binding protein [Saprospiraceae bacterium]|nr:ATP-binding protein [Saprospiraceae bacterium]
MKSKLNQLIFNSITSCIFLAILGFIGGAIIEKHAHQSPDVALYAQELEEKLHESEKEIDDLLNNGSFLLNAVEGYVHSDTIEKYINKPYTFIIYNDNDSIIYWNNNKVLPFQSDIHYTKQNTTNKYEISGSIFFKIHRPYEFKINEEIYFYNLEVLIPIYRHFSIQNNYLEDNFPLMPKEFSDFVSISYEPTDFIIKDSSGQIILYLKVNDDYPYLWFIIFSSLLYFISSIFIFLAVHYLAKTIVKNGHMVASVLVFVSGFLFFRLFTIFFDFPFLLLQNNIFNIRFSDINIHWFYSLGDFLIDMILLFWFAIFVTKNIKPRHTLGYTKVQKIIFCFFSYFVVVLGLIGIQIAMRDIVMSTVISFEFDNFSHIDSFSLLALIGMGLLFVSYFFFTYRCFVLNRDFHFSYKSRMIMFLITLCCGFIFASYINVLPIDRIVVCTGSIAQGLALTFFTQRKTYSLAWLSLWLVLFSSLGTIMLENANTDKGLLLRKDFAKSLAFERDIETENTFKSIVPNILNDGLLNISINNPLSPSPRKQAIDLITYRYLDNYFFGRYDYSVHIYTEYGRPFRGEKRNYKKLINNINNSLKTNSKHLHFYSHPDGNYSYFAKLPISKENTPLGIIIIEFKPKKSFKKSNIYVELLSQNKKRLDKIYGQFNYALYKYGQRVSSNSSIFKAKLNYDLPLPEPGEYRMLTTNNTAKNNYLIYRNLNNGNNISIIKIPKSNIFRFLSIFAYIFCFGVFLLLGGQFINFTFRKITGLNFIDHHFENSLREQIQRGIILVTLASFVAVAIITILYYSIESEEYHRARLLRKINSTARTAIWQIHQSKDSITKLPEAKSLADIHKIDVNIYDLGGNLVSSSEEVIFERHLLSRKMEPRAFQRMRHEQHNLVPQKEIINNFEYLSAYVPLKDKNEITIAYLNLPYDLAGSKNIGSQDVAVFLGALLNVYVIFLLIAGGAAFFIANSVTNPLSVIGEKLDKIELGKKNDPIVWDKNDEIGDLVERYNLMIKELEENTKKLARSQRESAWREMAKQVAHEIKNPLTPMKLNIQLLDKIINTNPEKAQDMVKRVAQTLIEQIDSLAHIASEFSTFAKMPIANNKKQNLNELVNNAYNLFKEEEHIQLTLEMTGKQCTIFADKNQIMRVLNNLLKNAIQSIPEDQPGIITIKLYDLNNTAIVKVTDNGCGIPKAQKDDIFVPNFTTKSSGTGIGLAMSKTIMEMAKGQIYFDSEEGKGSQFFVEWPLV